MADDNYQRPHGGGERFGRSDPPRHTPANDPLAELARLIGQNDPFAEFGRAPQPRASSPQQAPAPQYQEPPQGWDKQGYAAPPVVPGYEQGVGAQDQYADERGQGVYDAASQRGYYEDDYRDNDRYSYGDGQPGDEAYDDIPPRRNRLGVIVIASVVTVAIVGTAAAFGYRALFGSSGSSPPPVIKADTGPSKVVPPNKSETTAANKQFNDRVGERIVSREEQPMERPQAPAFPMPSIAQQAAAIPETQPMQSIAEPKRVRTIAIRPDGQAMAQPEEIRSQPPAAQPPAAQPPAQPPARPATAPRSSVQPQPPQASPPPQRVASAPIASADAEPPVTAAAPQQPRPAPSRNAPLSLSPDGQAAPARIAAAPARAATPPAPAPAAAGGQYGVQVSSQRSEAEAQAAFRALQAKFPSQLGTRQPVIRRADLGEKGVYYRAMVPFSNGSEAVALCNSLKAAGGSCIIQKN